MEPDMLSPSDQQVQPAVGDQPARQSPSSERPVLTVEGITVTFGATVALNDVTVKFESGRIHGLIGENGSGKSTIVKVIAGALRPDRGVVRFGANELTRNAKDVSTRVACVYQDGSLIEQLTVGQNLDLLVTDSSVTSQKDWRRCLLADFGLDHVDLAARIGEVPKSAQRLIEAAGVLAGLPEIVLFDESTSSLDERGVSILLRRMEYLAEAGSCVIFVTHRLHEILAVTSEITVLRDGHLVHTDVPTAGATTQMLVDFMAGLDVAPYLRRAVSASQATDALVASGLGGEHFGPIDLVVRSGEIIGIGGAAGNGQSELIRALGGQGIDRGEVRVNGRPIRSIASAVGAGAVFVSSDRCAESLFPELSIRENVTLSLDATQGRWWHWLSQRTETSAVVSLMKRFGVVASSAEQPVTSLSGGNQQKVAVGRAIEREPSVLLIEEPTEGVDVRARHEIYRALELAAGNGAAIVLTSSDASELRVVADRVVVLARGREVARLHGDEVTEQAIVHAFTTVTREVNAPARSDTEAAAGLAALTRSARNAVRQSANLAVLLAIIVGLGIYGSGRYPGFSSTSNVASILTLCVPLALVAVAQMNVLLVGELDASLGALMGLVVVVLSFFPTVPVWLLLVISVGLGAVLGAVNAALVVLARVSAVIATIATLGMFSGVGLLLRPTPAGLVNLDLPTAVRSAAGFVPWFFVGVVVICVVVDLLIARTRRGLSARATGYSAERARRLGVQADRRRALAYVTAGAIGGVAGFCLAGLTGVGDSSVGSGYTLLAFAVPVIGGTLLSGGRASALGCLAGAVFIAEVQNFIPFMSLPSGAYLVVVGVLTLITLALASGRRT
jgi:ABC-type sugar transport system ATPase subunit/ribose/xylose/arabinose/galactoside ABC-type transport system permease subunit